MSLEAIKWSQELPITGNRRLVLRCLIDRCNAKNNFTCWPSIKTICLDSGGLSDKTVRRSLNELVEKKIILRSKKCRNNNQYRLNINQNTLHSVRSNRPISEFECGQNDRFSAVKMTGLVLTSKVTSNLNNSSKDREKNIDRSVQESTAADLDNFKPTDSHYEFARKHGIDIELVVKQFKKKYKFHGDLNKAFQGYLEQALRMRKSAIESRDETKTKKTYQTQGGHEMNCTVKRIHRAPSATNESKPTMFDDAGIALNPLMEAYLIKKKSERLHSQEEIKNEHDAGRHSRTHTNQEGDPKRAASYLQAYLERDVG